MKTNGKIMLGAGAAGAVAFLLSRGAKAAEVDRKLDVVLPSRRRGGQDVVVPFTTKQVFWRRHPKTGRAQLRTVVLEKPAELAAEAGRRLGREIPLGTFTLATLIASEVGTGHPLARAAVAWAAKTAAKRAGKTLHEQVVHPFGVYGSQQGRYAASKNPPSVLDIELAEAIEAGKISNPSPGAVQWDSPRAQRALVARGEAGYDRGNTPEAVAKKRKAAGRVAVYLPGVDPDYLRLWRPVA